MLGDKDIPLIVFMSSQRGTEYPWNARAVMASIFTRGAREPETFCLVKSGISSSTPAVFEVDREAIRNAAALIQNQFIVCYSLTEWRTFERTCNLVGEHLQPAGRIEIDRVVRRLFRERNIPDRQRIASLLGTLYFEDATVDCIVRELRDAYAALAELLSAEGVSSPQEMRAYQEGVARHSMLRRSRFSRDFVRGIPDTPGVYLLRDSEGETAYVGKASRLRSRLKSYFSEPALTTPREMRLDEVLFSIEHKKSGSELEALLEEARLIKKLSPPVNVQKSVRMPVPPRYVAENVIIVLPSRDPGSLELFMLAGDRNWEKIRIRRGVKRLPARVAHTIRSVFFPNVRRRSPTKLEYLSLAWRWFERNRDKISFIEVNNCSGIADCLRLVRLHANAEGAGYLKHHFV